MESETFKIVADTIAEECGVPREKITAESNVSDDLGLDSLAFLDVCYALDVKLNIKIPFEQWVSDINAGKLDPKELFNMRNLVAEIDKFIRNAETATQV
jgi:acyl carrier protein